MQIKIISIAKSKYRKLYVKKEDFQKNDNDQNQNEEKEFECEFDNDIDNESSTAQSNSNQIGNIAILKSQRQILDSKAKSSSQTLSQINVINQLSKEPFLKEMSYSVYGENLENTLKLLSCQKTISLIDKKDPKSKRTFITAQCPPISRSKKANQALNEELDNIIAYKPQNIFASHVLEKNQRLNLQAKYRKQINLVTELQQKYCSVDDYKNQVLADIQPVKRREIYSLLNPNNLESTNSQQFNSSHIFQSGQLGNLYGSRKNSNFCTINQFNKTQQLPSQLDQASTQNGGRQSVEQDVYKRFRYNFYYWLKNFKQTEDGQFQFVDPSLLNQDSKLETQKKNLIGVVLDQNHQSVKVNRLKSDLITKNTQYNTQNDQGSDLQSLINNAIQNGINSDNAIKIDRQYQSNVDQVKQEYGQNSMLKQSRGGENTQRRRLMPNKTNVQMDNSQDKPKTQIDQQKNFFFIGPQNQQQKQTSSFKDNKKRDSNLVLDSLIELKKQKEERNQKAIILRNCIKQRLLDKHPVTVPSGQLLEDLKINEVRKLNGQNNQQQQQYFANQLKLAELRQDSQEQNIGSQQQVMDSHLIATLKQRILDNATVNSAEIEQLIGELILEKNSKNFRSEQNIVDAVAKQTANDRRENLSQVGSQQSSNWTAELEQQQQKCFESSLTEQPSTQQLGIIKSILTKNDQSTTNLGNGISKLSSLNSQLVTRNNNEILKKAATPYLNRKQKTLNQSSSQKLFRFVQPLNQESIIEQQFQQLQFNEAQHRPHLLQSKPGQNNNVLINTTREQSKDSQQQNELGGILQQLAKLSNDDLGQLLTSRFFNKRIREQPENISQTQREQLDLNPIQGTWNALRIQQCESNRVINNQQPLTTNGIVPQTQKYNDLQDQQPQQPQLSKSSSHFQIPILKRQSLKLVTSQYVGPEQLGSHSQRQQRIFTQQQQQPRQIRKPDPEQLAQRTSLKSKFLIVTNNYYLRSQTDKQQLQSQPQSRQSSINAQPINEPIVTDNKQQNIQKSQNNEDLGNQFKTPQPRGKFSTQEQIQTKIEYSEQRHQQRSFGKYSRFSEPQFKLQQSLTSTEF
eukprot:403343678